MQISGVKITLIMCLTILVSIILFISYNEYIHRYEIVATQKGDIYIFDKKSTILNRCNEKECEIIKTNLPSENAPGLLGDMSPSKMFGSQKPMHEEIVKKEAIKAEKTDKKDEEKNSDAKKEENKDEVKKDSEKKDNTTSEESKKSEDSQKEDNKKESEKKDDKKDSDSKEEAKKDDPKKEEEFVQ